jgi:hypothetical protein
MNDIDMQTIMDLLHDVSIILKSPTKKFGVKSGSLILKLPNNRCLNSTNGNKPNEPS